MYKDKLVRHHHGRKFLMGHNGAAQYHGWLSACKGRLNDKVEAVWVDGMKVSHLHHILLAASIIIIIKCSLGYSLSCVVRGWTPWGEGRRAHFVSCFVQGDQPCLKLSSLTLPAFPSPSPTLCSLDPLLCLHLQCAGLYITHCGFHM